MTSTTRKARTLGALLALILAAAFASGCTRSSVAPADTPAAEPTAAYPVSITDDASRTVEITSKPQRIVSLAPANTEILFAIGAGDRVFGVTSQDDYPAEVADIAKVGDFAGPNIEAVAAAQPDLIVATTGVQADMIAKLEELGATVIAIDPATLDGLYEDITEIGQATGDVAGAEKTVAAMKAEVAAVEQAVAGQEPVTTFVEIAQNPLFTVGTGTLIDEFVTIAGGTNIVAEPGYVPYSAEQLFKADPQVYMATLGSMSDPAQLEQRAGFAELSAVKNDRVYVLDDNLVSRPGPRAVLGLRKIAEALHPQAFGQ